jgi:hypothetical protein
MPAVRRIMSAKGPTNARSGCSWLASKHTADQARGSLSGGGGMRSWFSRMFQVPPSGWTVLRAYSSIGAGSLRPWRRRIWGPTVRPNACIVWSFATCSFTLSTMAFWRSAGRMAVNLIMLALAAGSSTICRR